MKLIKMIRDILLGALSQECLVDYVCGNGEALPLPFSPEEEGEMLRLLAMEEEKERAKKSGIFRPFFAF